MSKLRKITLLAAVALLGTGAIVMGLPILKQKQADAARIAKPAERPAGVAVSVVRAETADFTETALVTGTLVPRNEVLVGPEVEGLRVIEVLVEEGDRVKKGQVLARLVTDTLEATLAQNDASLARANAAIAQARSNIVQAEARLTEAKNQFERAKPLKQSGYLSGSTYDARESAARTAESQVVSARDGLKVAEADLAQVQAQRREVMWKRGNTDIKAPADGIISRRDARVGGFASGAAGAIFRIIADGDIELDAEVPEAILSRIRQGQTARITVMSHGEVTGRVRLVSPEVDKNNRLGRVRIGMGADTTLRIGSFGRGLVETATSRGLALPVSAVLYSADGAFVQVVREDRVVSTKIGVGITAGGRVEVKQGLQPGDVVVARAGTFLRDGDLVRPIMEPTKLSEAR